MSAIQIERVDVSVRLERGLAAGNDLRALDPRLWRPGRHIADRQAPSAIRDVAGPSAVIVSGCPMLQKAEIVRHLQALERKLGAAGVKGEVCLYGGAVMCLVYDARPATKDVDAIFVPTREIRRAALAVANDEGLPADWLNDGVKGFLVEHPRRILLDLPALKVFVPEPDYLLAMKTLASRVDATDRDDVRFLIRHMNLTRPAQVFEILEQYYPHQRIKPATQFFIEELFEDADVG